MNYPQPDENQLCLCQGAPMAAFFCQFGHMLECHYPYDCQTAACSHLHQYDFTEEDIERLESDARDNVKFYTFDEHGNAVAEGQDDGTVAEKIARAIEELKKRGGNFV